jgi:hypothetical protein
VEGCGNLHFFFSSRLEALMDPNVHCDSEQEARDCTTATMSSPFMAVPAVEPKPMEYEEWRVQVRSVCGAYSPEGADPKTFAGSIRPVSVWGCEAVVTSCNIHRMERTTRDVRLDGMEHYYAMLYLAGRTTVIQNDRVEQLDAGDIGLMDSTQPVTYIAEEQARAMALCAPPAPEGDRSSGIRAGRWLVQTRTDNGESPLFPSHSGCRQ